MREYNRAASEDLDEYEEDEYEEEEGEEMEEYEEEEPPEPTKEEQEYLQFRQRLKEQKRKVIRKESGSIHSNGHDRSDRLPFNNFGSFFGPSQPVIAQRVIQESKSLVETQHLASKHLSSQHNGKKTMKPAAPVPKLQNHQPKVNEKKMTVQKIKDTRDYSFLLSDDAVPPAPVKDSRPHSESRSQTDSQPRKDFHTQKVSRPQNGTRLQKDSRPREFRPQKDAQHQKDSRPQKMTVSNPEVRPSHDAKGKQLLGSSSRQFSSREEGRSVSTQIRKQPISSGASLAASYKSNSTSHKMPNSVLVNSRKPPEHNYNDRTRHPVGRLASDSAMKKQPSASKNAMSALHKATSSRMQTSTPKQQFHHKEYAEPKMSKGLPKQPMVSSRPLISKSSKPNPSHRKKPAPSYYDDDAEAALAELRNMIGYDRRKFVDDDDDSSDMEANFEDIQREEKRSARIARQEDDIELQKIEEEERRARQRKLEKKRKLSQR